MTCTRCPASGFSSEGQLFAHFVEHHSMKKDRAEKIAAREWAEAHPENGNGHAVTPAALLPVDAFAPHHACPKCETKIPCMWETIARVEEQAMRLKIIATQMRNRQLGLSNGGAVRKNADWTDEDAYNAFRTGLSIRAVSRLLGCATATAEKAIKRVELSAVAK